MITMIKPDKTTDFTKKTERTLRVVTHDGLFHSDEVFATALLQLFHTNMEIVRTRDRQILQRATHNPEVYVLDVGGEYNPARRNFDHHQQDAPVGLSTIALVFEHLFPGYKNDRLLEKVYNRLIKGINEWDQGKADRILIDHPLHLPQVISAFNRFGTPDQDLRFLKAVDFAHTIIGNEFNTAREMIRAEEIWEKKEKLNGETALLHENCVFWRTIQGKNPQYKYVVQPEEKNWQVLSVDSARFPLPEVPSATKGLVFQHKDRFITIFNNFTDAMKYVNQYILK